MNDDSSLPSPRSDPASPLVMLVEDDVRVRSLLAGVLDTAGFRLSAFGDPTEALAAARTLPKIDVLVTDVGLSDLSGTELADRVRELHPGAEILFMSGFAAPEDFRDRFHDHEDRFLQKPFRPAEFVARVIHFSARERWHAEDRSAPAAG